MSMVVSENAFSALDQEKKELIRTTLCQGATDVELQLFFHVCEKSGLDPLLKQVYFVKRAGKGTIQTGIDGLRIIAERTGKYAPGQETVYTYDASKKVASATAYVKKQTVDGTWHTVSATAFVEEYKPTYSNDFWKTKPHIMIAKCAEALALRKAFPAQMAGVYVAEEMQKGVEEAEVVEVEENKVLDGNVSFEQSEKLFEMLKECEEDFQERVLAFMEKRFKARTFDVLPLDMYQTIFERIFKHLEQTNINNVA